MYVMKISKKIFPIFCILLCAITIKLPADTITQAQATGSVIQSDGSILAVGTADVNNKNQFVVARYTTNGALDTTFNNIGITTTSIGTTADGLGIALQSNGKSVVAGYTYLSGISQVALARYNTDGSSDTTFGVNGVVTTSIANGASGNAIAIDSSGNSVVAGAVNINGVSEFLVARYTPTAGALDSSFNSSGSLPGTTSTSIGYRAKASAVAIQPSDGKIVVAGYGSFGNNDEFAVARYNTDGSLDTTGFNSSGSQPGVVTTQIGTIARAQGLIIQSDGSIIVVGNSDNAICLASYTSAGVLNTAFGTGGIVTTSIGSRMKANAVTIDSSSNLIVAGFSDNYLIVLRYTSTGSLDTTFNSTGYALTSYQNTNVGNAVQILSNGDILIVGFADGGYLLVAYNGSGNIDGSWGSNGVVAQPPLVSIQTVIASNNSFNPVVNPNLLRAAWFIDPIDGNDANDGLTAITALRTYKELLSRWGGVDPILQQSTTVTFLNDQPDFSDPVEFSGHLINDGILTFTGQLTQVASGTFSSIVTKNRSTGQRWNVTDNLKPANFWQQWVGYLVHDTTADAWFWVDSNLGSSTAVITEPLAQGSINNPSPAFVTISSGDNYIIYKPTKIYLVNFSPISISQFTSELSHIWIIGPSGLGGFDNTFTQTFTFMLESRCDTTFNQLVGLSAAGSTTTNSWLGGGEIYTSAFIFGGSVGTEFANLMPGSTLLLDGDVAIDAPLQNVQGTVIIGAAYWNGDMDIPNIFSLGAGTAQVYVTSNAIYGVAALWGSGAINVHVGGDLGYSGSAAGAFLKSGGLTLDGATTANAFNLTVNPGVWNTGITLTPANLDASIGTGGFGNIAYGNLGSKIRQIA
jgi:uncharacterized delta-60 repeat protein